MKPSPPVTAEFLDGEQYARAAIRAYESVYGEDFVSPGGAQVARELIARLALAPAARVLDAGCGLGGSAFLMAREFGLRVDGIDVSRNMLSLAGAKCDAYGLRASVTLEHGDCSALDRPARYDAIYSRDVFLHIEDKRRLFGALHAALRPGGRLLFTDYACGEKPWSEAFSAYVESRVYFLHTLPEYVGLLEGAGFAGVRGHDWSARFIAILEADLARIAAADLDDAGRSRLAASWRAKLARARSGDHRWVMLEAARAG